MADMFEEFRRQLDEAESAFRAQLDETERAFAAGLREARAELD